jgi:glycosyltransferase involved in cell wall biosynthesis
MRVVILTHYYPPEVGAPQRRLEALASGLAARGAQVTVHTGFPRYPAGKVLAPYRNRPLAREGRPPLRIVRSAVYPTANSGVARRLADHAAFAGSALLAGAAAGRADVVVAESPPLFLAAAAVPYARLRRARLVLHVSDLWPDSAIEMGALRNRAAIRAARVLERAAYRGSALIVAPTRGIVNAVGATTEGGQKAVLIPPSVDLEGFAVPPLSRDGPLRVVYAGTVGMAQGLETLVEAARLAGPERVHVTIAGAGAELAAVRGRASGLDHVRVIGSVPAAAVAGLYAEADVGAVLLRDLPIFRGAVPTKTLEALAAGRPVLLSAEGEAADLVADGDAGVVVPPGDPAALAAAIERMADMPGHDLAEMGARGRVLAERHGRNAIVEQWMDVLGGLG